LTKTGKRRASAISQAVADSLGYALSQVCRKKVECPFGYAKKHGALRQVMLRGLDKVKGCFLLHMIGYNLVRIPKLAVI
jgi:hypothetical protein